MNKFLYTKTLSSLKHLQAVTLIISLAVFFSAAVLMSLISLSNSFKDILIDKPEEKFGANVKIVAEPAKAHFITDELNSMQSKGDVKNYTEITRSNYSRIMKGREQIYADLIGVWDAKYPLNGEYTLAGNDNNLLIKLKDSNDVLLSKEAAEKLKIKVGDSVSYISSDYLNTYTFNVVGLIESSPDRGNSQVIMRGSTLQNIEPYMDREILIKGNEANIKNELQAKQGKNIAYTNTLSEYNKQQDGSTKKLNAFLRAIGILGLFVGSLGIASSIQVIINRRKNEIAILKIIGYKKSQITKMFLIELSIISLGGSLLGVGAGYLFCRYLVSILSTLGMTYTFDLSFDFLAAGIAIIASVFSAILFSLITINNYTRLKPMDVLKDSATRKTWKNRFIDLVFFLLISAVFIGLSIAITSSVPIGVGAVVLVFVGVYLSRILIQILFRLILLLPIKTHNVLELAWLNLKASYKQYSLAGMAIFIGLTVLALLITLMNNATFKFDSNTFRIDQKVNIISYRSDTTDNKVTNKIANISPDSKIYKKLRTEVDKTNDVSQNANTNSHPTPNIIEGRDTNNYDWDIVVQEGKLIENAALLPASYKEYYKVGDIITIKKDNIEHQLQISGFYERNEAFTDENIEPGYDESIILPMNNFIQLTPDHFQEVVLVIAQKNKVTKIADGLASVDGTVIIDSVSLEKEINSQISLLKQFLFSLSGLALVAGIILIINATSLEVFNRKRGFAIFKTIGFSSEKVRLMLLLEYTLMLGITSLLAIGTSYGVVSFFNKFSKQLIGVSEKLTYSFGDISLLALFSCVLILILVMSVSYRPLKIKPSEVLRYE